MCNIEDTIIIRPGNDLNDALKKIFAVELERAVRLRQVAQIEEESEAGFEPSDDGVCCKICGVPTEDDSFTYCAEHMPICAECEKPNSSLDRDGICADCVDLARERRSWAGSKSWDGNSRGAP